MPRIFIECTPEYKQELKGIAKSKGMTVSGYIRHLIEKQKEYDRSDK